MTYDPSSASPPTLSRATPLSQGQQVRNRAAWYCWFRRINLVVSALIGAGLVWVGFNSWDSYQQVTYNFDHLSHFIPTRVYSDLTPVKLGMSRLAITKRLSGLGYVLSDELSPQTLQEFTAESPLGSQVAFKVMKPKFLAFLLHPLDYPARLLLQGQAQVEAEAIASAPMPAVSESPVCLSLCAADFKEAEAPLVEMHFESGQEQARLVALRVNHHPRSAVFLEPQLVASLQPGWDRSSRVIRDPLQFSSVPAQVWQAIMAVEDHHFLDHPGLDPSGIARAMWVNVKTLSFAQGGSTLTQQLVKNLLTRRGKNLGRKVNEAILALLLEVRYSKKQILERYLNEVYLGQVGALEVHGVAEGAELFFGKRLEDLNTAEIALMAGLVRGPGYYSPYRFRERAVERQRAVLKKMAEAGYLSENEAKAASDLPLRFAAPQAAASQALFFVDFVKAELLSLLKEKMSDTEIMESGLKVYTSLDLTLNQQAQLLVSEGVSQWEQQHHWPAGSRLEAILASAEVESGFLKVLIGGRDHGQSAFNRILNMKRQVGSTFKPIIYLAAFLQGKDPVGVPYGPAHLIEDAPWTWSYDHGRQAWSPQNYERAYLGWMSYRQALAASVNVAAAKLLQEVGLEKVTEVARSLGVTSDLPQVPSLALGVAELSPLELLKVYQTLAHQGVRKALGAIRVVSRADGSELLACSHPVESELPAPPVELLTDMLASVVTSGTAQGIKKLGFLRPAAGKTGTTSDHHDAWFIGFTPRQLTTVVWVGLDRTQEAGRSLTKSLEHLTGASAALPIWARFTAQAVQSRPTQAFALSEGLERLTVDRRTGQRPEAQCPESEKVEELFVKTGLNDGTLAAPVSSPVPSPAAQ